MRKQIRFFAVFATLVLPATAVTTLQGQEDRSIRVPFHDVRMYMGNGERPAGVIQEARVHRELFPPEREILDKRPVLPDPDVNDINDSENFDSVLKKIAVRGDRSVRVDLPLDRNMATMLTALGYRAAEEETQLRRGTSRDLPFADTMTTMLEGLGYRISPNKQQTPQPRATAEPPLTAGMQTMLAGLGYDRSDRHDVAGARAASADNLPLDRNMATMLAASGYTVAPRNDARKDVPLSANMVTMLTALGYDPAGTVDSGSGSSKPTAAAGTVAMK